MGLLLGCKDAQAVWVGARTLIDPGLDPALDPALDNERLNKWLRLFGQKEDEYV